MRRIRPQKLSFRAKSPFNSKDDFIEPKIWDRINENISCGKINTIAIEGASQTGKSTFGTMICEHYDKNYGIWYNTEDVFATMDFFKDEYERLTSENPDLPIMEAIKPLMFKWYLFEEPDAEASKIKWRSERTQAIIRIINMYGFLKIGMVLCMPDMDELGSGFFRNLTYRVFITLRKRQGKIVRKATFYRPYKPVGQPKWKWYGIGEYEIPELKLSNEYFKKKLHNFFDDKLQRYKGFVKNEDNKYIGHQPEVKIPDTPERIAHREAAKKLMGLK